MKVQEVMSEHPECCTPEESLADAARVMWDRDCGFVPVVEAGSRTLAGVLTDRDACMAAWTKGRALRDVQVGEVMTRVVVSCGPGDDAESAIELLREHQLHRLPVVDDERRVIGVFSISDAGSTLKRMRGAVRERASAQIGESIAAIHRPRALAPAACATFATTPARVEEALIPSA